MATGTRLRPPGNMPGDGSKSAGVAYLQSIQRELEKAQRIVILGGGAVGVRELSRRTRATLFKLSRRNGLTMLCC